MLKICYVIENVITMAKVHHISGISKRIPIEGIGF